MAKLKSIVNNIKYKGFLGLYFYIFCLKTYKIIFNYIFPNKYYLSKKFKFYHGYHLDWNNLKTLNEKIQWLKINDRKSIYTKLSDKYLVREYISEHFGSEYLIPLILETRNVNDLASENLPEYPVIVKANHDSGNFLIIRNKREVNFKKLQADAKVWLSFNYFYEDREWPYKNIIPRVVVEKLLMTSEGKIPNDYKLNYINGKLEFIYVAFDREGLNKRKILNDNWEELNFKWSKKSYADEKFIDFKLEPPQSLDLMKKFGAEIAKMYDYVRVDFYDVDGKLYFGEITQYHGGGFDSFSPFEYDQYYGSLLKIGGA